MIYFLNMEIAWNIICCYNIIIIFDIALFYFLNIKIILDIVELKIAALWSAAY
jgi:hypothetical protein